MLVVNLVELSVMDDACVNLSNFPLSVSQANLVAELQSDAYSMELVETMIQVAEVKDKVYGYILSGCFDKGSGCFDIGNPTSQI